MAGGSPYNVATAAARLGVPTQLYSRVGADPAGDLLVEVAERNGVDVAGVARISRWTGLAITSVDEAGSASYEFRIDDQVDWALSATERARVAQASILHFGSIASWQSPSERNIRVAAEETTALVTYDPNIRPPLLRSREAARAVVERNIAVSNVVKASDEDLLWLYPGASVSDVAGEWLRLGPALVVVTAGGGGATAFRAGYPPLHRPSFEVTVVDTVGAGDSSMAALIAGLHQRAIASSDAIAGMAETDLISILDDALLAAALTCARRGANPPTIAELNVARRRLQATTSAASRS
jgi:fructokinase